MQMPRPVIPSGDIASFSLALLGDIGIAIGIGSKLISFCTSGPTLSFCETVLSMIA
jgi:hypothetical protein